jgi:hypothetical protein
MYAGAQDAEALLRRYRVDYVLISPAETSGLPVSMQFWSRYPLAARIGPYRLYRTNISEERARQ